MASKTEPTLQMFVTEFLQLQQKFADQNAKEFNAENLKKIDEARAEFIAAARKQEQDLQFKAQQLEQEHKFKMAQIEAEAKHRTALTTEQERVAVSLAVANKTLSDKEAEIAKLKAKPPPSIGKQLLDLAPDTLRVAAVAIPIIGPLTVESIKFTSWALTVGLCVYLIGEGGTTIVNLFDVGVQKANFASKAILLTGALIAARNGARSAMQEGPQALTSGMNLISAKMNKIRARLIPQSEKEENSSAQSAQFRPGKKPSPYSF